MQRFKQNNLGMHPRLLEDELLVAQGPAFPDRGGVRRIKLRVEVAGYAECARYEIAPHFSTFQHRSLQLDAPAMLGLVDACRRVADEHLGEVADDPNAVYRTIEFRDGAQTHLLRLEYRQGIPHPAAPAFEAAWALLEGLFTASQD